MIISHRTIIWGDIIPWLDYPIQLLIQTLLCYAVTDINPSFAPFKYSVLKKDIGSVALADFVGSIVLRINTRFSSFTAPPPHGTTART
mmetsp:Transcript_18035/g.30179  ORF Transcript_18035/g.30179 Transcript_18035/m.30179 type:complete len:88 (+) Transcript_18035:104-367(+)